MRVYGRQGDLWLQYLRKLSLYKMVFRDTSIVMESDAENGRYRTILKKNESALPIENGIIDVICSDNDTSFFDQNAEFIATKLAEGNLEVLVINREDGSNIIPYLKGKRIGSYVDEHFVRHYLKKRTD